MNTSSSRLKSLICVLFIIIIAEKFEAQDFINNDLNGTVSGSSSLPTSWQNVPDTDPNCLANFASGATPDLTNILGPTASNGINGKPYSGNTFVSALMGGAVSPGFFYHEGIMQTVSGFSPGCSYTINFHQTVVKQVLTDYLDSSGSWSVYIDNTLAGTTVPTVNPDPYDSISLPWEFRTISFIASATSHTIKFLPADDDNDQNTATNSYAGLRMGIDSIYIKQSTISNLVWNYSDTILCEGEILTLNATTANATYLWQDNSTSSTYNITQQGTYWVNVFTNCGVKKDTVNVNYNPSPVLELGNDTTICAGQTLTLDATTSGASYLWQDNSISATYTVTQQGAYTVEVTLNNCSARDTINVIYDSLPAFNLENDTAICEGNMLTLDATIPNASYLWQDNSTNPIFNVTEQGTYWVEVSTECGIKKDSIEVSYNPLPTFYLENDTTICEDDTLVFDVTTSNASYLWQDNSTSPTFAVTQQGTYWVTVTLNNCIATKTVTVIQNVCDSLVTDTICKEVFVPTAFSPNNDGQNDWECVLGNCIESMTFAIYNRWGNKVFETNNFKDCWDGSYNGKEVNGEVYMYYLNTKLQNKEVVTKKGNITLIK